MSKFMGYAMAASQEAFEDAGWKPKTEEEQEMTVRWEAFKQRCHIQLTVYTGSLHGFRHWQLRSAIRHVHRP